MPDTHYVSAMAVQSLEFSAMPRIQDARSIKPAGYQKKSTTSGSSRTPQASSLDAETASIATDQISLEKAEAQENAKPSAWRRLLKRSP